MIEGKMYDGFSFVYYLFYEIVLQFNASILLKCKMFFLHIY